MTENEKKTNQNIETEAQTAENTGVKEAVKNDFESNGGASANQTDGQNSHFEAGEKPEKTVPDVSKNKKKNVVICGSIVVALALIAGIATANSKPKADQKQPKSDKTADIAEKTDTEPPVITFKKDKLEVKVGDSYDVAANIKSVVDDQDGKLEQVKKLEDGQAGYIVKSEQIKEAKAGTFSVEVTAVDSAGNKAKANFDVVVSEAKAEEKTDTEKTSGADKEEKKETSSAKSGNSDKVSSSSTAKPSTGNSSSSGSKPSSSTSNSGSASKPSTGSSGSGSSKPSTGGSSSGSGSAAKPSGGSGSSGSTGGSNGGSTPAPKPKPDCKDVVVVDKEAWDEKVLVKDAYDEQVLVKDAWDEQILVKEAWDEIYYCAIKCVQCGQEFPFQYGDQNSLNEASDAWCLHNEDCENYTSVSKSIHHDAEYQTVHHDAEYKTVHHDAEYKTVHHDAVTHVVQVCS